MMHDVILVHVQGRDRAHALRRHAGIRMDTLLYLHIIKCILTDMYIYTNMHLST